MPQTASHSKRLFSYFSFSNIIWWMLLLTAVLAIPALSLILVEFFKISGTSQAVVFMVTCWICVYIGKLLVRSPAVSPLLAVPASMDIATSASGWEQYKAAISYHNMVWWLLLMLATLVVPAIAITLVMVLDASDTTEAVVFIVSCWLSVFFGLRLIQDSPITPYLFESISVSDNAAKRCSTMVSLIEAEMSQWEKRYDKCEPVFMKLSKQPAWDYILEITQTLIRMRHSIEQNSKVSLYDVKQLNQWVESAKPEVLQTYIHSLQAVYAYARAEFSLQGKDIDAIYPELNKGHLDTLANGPIYAKTFAHELLATLRKEHPFLARNEAGGMSFYAG